MTCKDCIHFEVCDSGRHIGEHIKDDERFLDGVEKQCVCFRDKARFLELPGRIGETVYCILQPCGGCPCFNEPMKEEYIERCRVCKKAEVAEMAFDYEMIPEVGETVFFDRERAEKELSLYINEGKINNERKKEDGK